MIYMGVLKIIIEKSSDHFSAYAENCQGVYGAGNTVELAKNNILEAIEMLKTANNCPVFLKSPYQILFHYDTESFLKYYSKVFSMPALEKLTGINQKQLHHYSSGSKKPRETQRKKIESAMHKLGKELLDIKF